MITVSPAFASSADDEAPRPKLEMLCSLGATVADVTMVVPAVGEGDNSGIATGVGNARPSSNCTPSNHQSTERVAADRRGSCRLSSHTTLTSSAACSDVHARRPIMSCAREAMLMSGLLAARLQLMHECF